MVVFTSADPPGIVPGPVNTDEAFFGVQDDLLVVHHDLDRLKGLLSETCAELANGFQDASAMIAAKRKTADADTLALLDALDARLSSAVTALQFEDMANQLISYTCRVLRSSADRLAAMSFGGDDDGEAVCEERPRRPNPVTQDEMDAGSIELF